MAGGVHDELHLDPAGDAGAGQHGRIARLRLEITWTGSSSCASRKTSPVTGPVPPTTPVPMPPSTPLPVKSRGSNGFSFRSTGRNVLRDVRRRHHRLKSLRRGIRGHDDVWWRLFRWRLGWLGRLQEDHRRVDRTILDGLGHALRGLHGPEISARAGRRTEPSVPSCFGLFCFDSIRFSNTLLPPEGGVIVPGK